METTNTALLSVIYTEQSYHAQLRITSHMTEDDMTTILHARIVGEPLRYDLLPFDNFRDIPVSDGECLAVIVHQEGSVVASGIFEVCIGLSEELGAVLVPRCINNILIDQCDSATIENACNEIGVQTTTGELSQEAEVAQ